MIYNFNAIKNNVELYFKGRFELKLLTKESDDDSKGMVIETFPTLSWVLVAEDKNDGKKHQLSFANLATEREIIEKLNQIIIDKRDDTIDSIIENWTKL